MLMHLGFYVSMIQKLHTLCLVTFDWTRGDTKYNFKISTQGGLSIKEYGMMLIACFLRRTDLWDGNFKVEVTETGFHLRIWFKLH